MTVAWTKHRFSGGALALDVANTVVLRSDPARRFDRFADPAEIKRFAEAASMFRAEELEGRALVAPEPGGIHGRVVEIREATDCALRWFVETKSLDSVCLAAMLRACAGGLETYSGALRAADPAERLPMPLETAVSVSAISLLSGDRLKRLRLCQTCGWLFLDRSRNGSRRWCDMAVCGNRQKARRHHLRKRTRESEVDHA